MAALRAVRQVINLKQQQRHEEEDLKLFPVEWCTGTRSLAEDTGSQTPTLWILLRGETGYRNKREGEASVGTGRNVMFYMFYFKMEVSRS